MMDRPELSYDPQTATIQIDGVSMSWEFFRMLAETKPGTWIHVEPAHTPREFVLRSVSDEVAKTFNAILGIG